MRFPLVLAGCALACASLPAAAQQLKPGLWEISSSTSNPQLNQAMAQMQQQLATMPPAQRKQMEEMMAKQGVRTGGGASGGMAVRTCLTQEAAERSDMPLQDGCQVTSQQRSGNTMTMAFSCANPPSSGEGRVTFASPVAYSSSMTVRTTVAGRTETMTVEGAGKWLQADCGNVRPAAAAAAAKK